jgi:esterase/lipase
MSDYVEEFLGQLSHKKNDEVHLFGFSLGAMIAVIAADKIKPKGLLLCSLSPYFKEDLKYVKKSWRDYMGKNRMSDFKNFSFQDLVGKINYKIVLVVGGREDKTLIKKAKNTHKKVKNSELFIIDAGHDISNKNYKNKIFEISKSL